MTPEGHPEHCSLCAKRWKEACDACECRDPGNGHVSTCPLGILESAILARFAQSVAVRDVAS